MELCKMLSLKGIVCPKTLIVSPFTHPHVVPNLYKFLSYVEHKIYFEPNSSTLTSIVGKEILWNTMEEIFYVQHKRENHTSLEQHEGE